MPKRDPPVRPVTVQRHHGSSVDTVPDVLAAEEPLEIRVRSPGHGDAARVAVTMRTPGHDLELALGFLLTENAITEREDVDLEHSSLSRVELGAVVTVALRVPFDLAELQRNFYATSSCGVCGKAALELVERRASPLGVGPTLRSAVITSLPRTLRDAQEVFASTGGLHAAGLFTADGALVALREDVGRHNALDKLLGWALAEGRLPLDDHAVMASGRLSFELVQKAAVAGVSALCAVSAPSSLAVQAAERVGMTLVGFVRGDGFNVYTRPERVVG